MIYRTPYNPSWNSLEACRERVQQAQRQWAADARCGAARPFSDYQHEAAQRALDQRTLPNKKTW